MHMARAALWPVLAAAAAIFAGGASCEAAAGASVSAATAAQHLSYEDQAVAFALRVEPGLLPIDPISPVEFWNLHLQATMDALPEDFEVIGADDLAWLSKEAHRLFAKTDDSHAKPVLSLNGLTVSLDSTFPRAASYSFGGQTFLGFVSEPGLAELGVAESSAAVCKDATSYCPQLADGYQGCLLSHQAPYCYKNSCCPSKSFGAYNMSSMKFYTCSDTPCLANCTQTFAKGLAPPLPPPPPPPPPPPTPVSQIDFSRIVQIMQGGLKLQPCTGYYARLCQREAHVLQRFKRLDNVDGGEHEQRVLEIGARRSRSDGERHCEYRCRLRRRWPSSLPLDDGHAD